MAKAKHNTKSSQKELLLKDIIAPKIQDYESLFANLDFNSFSYDITLQDYQIAALKSAITTLKLYLHDSETLYQSYLDAQTGIPLKDKIQKETINTASFWMATGSGKSIVMIKLIALLQHLFVQKELLQKPIMLLVPNDKILEQFKNHIREYNAYQSENIIMKDLKDYESTIAHTSLLDDSIIFIGRSDLLETSENVGKDSKAKRLNYKNFLNEQGWIVLLDEAHKGDYTDSVRKSYIRELARGIERESSNPKGFIFNFSATFSDSFDLQTCVFNYNLEKFNREGYGKNIAVLDSDLKSFKDTQNHEEQIIRILESFILFCAIKQHKQKILSNFSNFAESKKHKLQYHNPLIIAVADKVNTKDAGIRLYFEAILSILKLDRDITEIAKSLSEKLQNQVLYFESISFDKEFLECIAAIDSKILRKEIFYANETSAVEACKIKGNNKELCFKSKNADKPFLLLNIGSIKEWEKQYLLELGIESGEDITSGYFQSINESNSPIQIMMGSRVFSEGWDSNRVNLICFINIGSKNAKKYVLQTIGRGVRIEPFRGVRKRLEKCQSLEYQTKESLCKGSLGIETLFIMASQNTAIEGILEGLEDFIQTKPLNGFVKSKTFEPLLVPKYKDSSELRKTYKISQQDFENLQNYIESFDEDVLLLHENIQAKDLGYSILLKIHEKKGIEIFGDTKTLEAKNALKTLNHFFQSPSKIFERFEPLSDEICHYQKFSSTLDIMIVEEMNKRIKELILAKNSETKEELEQKGVLKEYIDTILQSLQEQKTAEVYGYILDSTLQEHYYNPLVIDKANKGEIIYAIKEQSEIEFIEDLQKYVKNKDNALKEYQWCFSRIVENVDSIFIPYFDEEIQEMRKFYPDFIFWFKHKQTQEYKIFFIDPKGLRHTDNARYKLKGFKNIFNKDSLKLDALNIKVLLFYYNKQNYPIEGMEEYIKSSIAGIFD
ncbi:DEAD/DEAH box helicase family protein [Helicobacter sp. MIT 05-5294]|uniref:DEAD/DEAH box helicase family protein n=1 Tax=Helicobacter sp. MIT 05-5294 TaxID=1548150 RepID=UPI00051FCF02|nr:DEAD/DEAH box helicase family protein [Helicobacter sp. MIT 05-5294]TLD86571.1 DEAD/DEAH box helicase [Helicobacter sp. MIT 05-5294]